MSIRNAFGTFKFTTDAPIILVKGNPTIYGSYPAWSHLRVSIDGVLSYILYDSEKYIEVALGTGTKTIEITEGGQTKPSGTILGTFITSIKVPDGFTYSLIDTDKPANKLLFIGDSITSGANCTYLTNGYQMKFRDAGENVSVLAWGYGSITNMAGTAGLITTLVGQIDTLMDGTAFNELIIMLGTNDYAVYETPVADFQSYYDALLQAINTSRSDMAIKCVSPIIRGSEVANSNGDTLDDFRAAIAAVCVGKAYCEYIEGKTLIAVGDLADGVHPDNDGHIALYNALVAAGI